MMKYSRASWLGCAVGVLCAMMLPGLAAADEAEAETASPGREHLRRRFIESRKSADAGRRFEALWAACGEGDPCDLILDADASIAVQAYWRCHYRRIVPTRKLLFGGGPYEELEPRFAARFVGFLEGRTGAAVPDWWHTRLADRLQIELPQYEPAEIGKIEVSRLASIRPAADDSGIEIDDHIDSCVVSEELFQKLQQPRFPRWTVRVDGSRLYVATHDEDGVRFPLYCVDTSAGRLLWRADVWAWGQENLLAWSGSREQYVDVSVREDRVFVFGAGTGGAYVEGFSCEDGRAAVRFATNNWLAQSSRRLDTDEPADSNSDERDE